MVGQLLWRGMLAGLIAGLFAAGIAFVAGEGSVDRAIAFESAAAQAAGEPEEPEIVSREVQRSVGLATAGALYGVGLGGFFALAFAFVNGRIGRLEPRAVAALVALAGFLVMGLAPWFKYPPNPPSVGQPETIGLRTQLYFGLVVWSALTAIIASLIYGRAAPRLGGWGAGLLAVALTLVSYAVAAAVLPPINEVPENFPADLLWRFRIASLGAQAGFWTALGLAFGVFVARLPGFDFAARRVDAPARYATF